MEIYLARQPIFNRSKHIYGYELLFRNGFTNAFPDIDGNTASSKVLSNSFFCMGIEQITGGNKAFINFTQELLLQKIPMLFPIKSLTVEILENVTPTEALVLACREIANAGYPLAMDDFIYDPALEPLIAMADVIKIDIRATPLDTIQEVLGHLSRYPAKLLAEKVETYEEYEKCLNLGFDYFQGYFFSKPEMLKAHDISPSRMSLLQIMAEINRDEIKLGPLETLILRDVSISFKLLRYINSAYFSRGQEISSIRQAILRLGDAGIRRFIPVVLMAALSDNKPDELIRTSVIRGRFCELLCENTVTRLEGPGMFTLGLFSLIDAIMDEPMASIVEKLPFSTDIREALISNVGEMARFLDLARAYEAGDWAAVATAAESIHIENDRIPMLYWDAVVWADTATSSI